MNLSLLRKNHVVAWEALSIELSVSQMNLTVLWKLHVVQCVPPLNEHKVLQINLTVLWIYTSSTMCTIA